MRRSLLLMTLALAGCATAARPAAGTPADLLSRIKLSQELDPAWHLRSIAAVEAAAAPPGTCRTPGAAPVEVALVYERTGPDIHLPLTITTCLSAYNRPLVSVHDTGEATIVAGRRPSARTAREAAGGGDGPGVRGVSRGRPLVSVPADIPRGLQVLLAGEKLRYAVEVCLDATGAVDNLRLQVKRHLAEVDGRVLDALRRWRYEPTRFDGHPAPSCTWAVLDL
jgi:hypothetical protein